MILDERRVQRLVAGLALLALMACSSDAGGFGDAVDGFECDATGREPVRARVTLHLVSEEGRLPATTGVGSTGSCNYAVRTEMEEGVIIVRGDQADDATLDTFLTIWEYAIPAGTGGAEAFRQAATDGEIHVNGQRVEAGPAAVPLRGGDAIELIAP